MRFNKLNLALAMLIATAAPFQPHARADEESQTAKMTFSAPVEIPGQVLPAGSFIFERADDNDLGNVVRILNADRTVLYATLETNPVDRRSPTDNRLSRSLNRVQETPTLSFVGFTPIA